MKSNLWLSPKDNPCADRANTGAHQDDAEAGELRDFLNYLVHELQRVNAIVLAAADIAEEALERKRIAGTRLFQLYQLTRGAANLIDSAIDLHERGYADR